MIFCNEPAFLILTCIENVRKSDLPVKLSVVKEMEEKISRFAEPMKKGYSIQRVLIVANGCEESVKSKFDKVITLDDLI